MNVGQFKFDAQGLIPAVVQDWRDGTVLMVAYMNREALERTVDTKSVYFWSRSRQALWEKGETSGHRLQVKDLFVDCDGDALLVKVEPVGPTCHTGERTCFFTRLDSPETKTSEAWGGILERLSQMIQERKRQPTSESYTSKLLEGGVDRILKKVVEEAGEVAIAGKGGNKDEMIYETADLLFHTLVALGYHGITLQDVYEELATRYGKSGMRKGTAS
ncbi:MAG TPA: bifunctional phosphoribosyl-AMP cyclohydrolase/phosphoribosyl-ATP diphosphatase HisIE [Nitrospiraceae bacterium]|jgi:phosphoribosyl-ATP pyrophosphohydrolase/phosphoribosyl-AMP cyclohydrolase